ncbi:Fe-S cluster assembly sulfur transfer protein SufU [Streptococcus marimammalium]|uniref:Fe-S cluster assembly sulfur transfer protein SufU n=1 Tax=Streptococcus marimammalium TaxID=269666 RepID=UPI0003734FCF|nr:SUF system NifU family Fe-S cluster assembly protein [Streptococcus marimammalium]
MALFELDNLYMAVVSDHSKAPRHYGTLSGVDGITLSNPTCGDVVTLYVQFEGDKISDIAFSGHGCAISTASASMMTGVMIGKTKEEALALADVFFEMVQGKKSDKEEQLGDASFLSGVSKFPQRIKCATLSWHALKKVATDSLTNKKNN